MATQAPGDNRDRIGAVLDDLLAATTRGGQLRCVTLLRELLASQSTEVVLPLRETLGDK